MTHHAAGRRRPRRQAVAGVIACALLLFVSACQDDENPPPDDGITEYVALGDSHTAAPHYPEDDLSVPCYRSETNYPHVLAKLLPNATLTDVSCSGATTAALTEEQMSRTISVPPQLDALSDDTDLVTVNVGGNDEGLFLNWAVQCAQLGPTDPDGSPCADASRVGPGDKLLDAVPQIKKNFAAVLRLVEERAPNAQVVVVTYPKAFPDQGTCKLVGPYATGDLPYINSLIKAVGDAMISVAKAQGVDWVDVYAASRGHDICSREPWTNGITNDQTRANVLHPLPEEQAAVARLVEALL
jgi:lysophospholipase L1-like esterase